MNEREGVTEDRLLGGVVTLLQRQAGHRAGTDAVLLAAFAEVAPGETVADIGAGTGAVALMIGRRVPGVRLLLIERDADLTPLCLRNIELNGMADRASVVAADIFASPEERRSSGLLPGVADVVVTNPPFYEHGIRSSPNPGRRAAHTMAGGGLREWLHAAADLLRPRGRLVMIHRADQMELCLGGMRPHFGSPEITPVYSKAGRPASRIVVRAIKGGRAPLRLAPPLLLHGLDGAFTPEAGRLHERVDLT